MKKYALAALLAGSPLVNPAYAQRKTKPEPSTSQQIVDLAKDYTKNGKPVVTSYDILQAVNPENDKQTFRLQLWNGNEVVDATGIRLGIDPVLFGKAFDVKPTSFSLSITLEKYLNMALPENETDRYRRFGLFGKFLGFENVYNDFDRDGFADLCFVNDPIEYQPVKIDGGFDLSNDMVNTISRAECQPRFEKEAKKILSALKEWKGRK